MIISILGSGFTMILLGPSYILGIPQKWYIVACSFPLLGFFQAFIFLPILPEVIERLQTSFNLTEDDPLYEKLNDKVNDFYGLFYACTIFVSPLIGSSINTSIGQAKLCDLIALVNLFFAIILIIFNCGF